VKTDKKISSLEATNQLLCKDKEDTGNHQALVPKKTQARCFNQD
jgi:hypothetical protein